MTTTSIASGKSLCRTLSWVEEILESLEPAKIGRQEPRWLLKRYATLHAFGFFLSSRIEVLEKVFVFILQYSYEGWLPIFYEHLIPGIEGFPFWLHEIL